MNPEETSKGQRLLIGALVAIGILLIAQIYSLVTINSLQNKTAALTAENTKSREWVTGELNKVREQNVAEATARQQNLDALRDDLQKAKVQAASAVGRAKTDATKLTEELAAKLADEEKKQQQHQQQVASQLSALSETASSAHAKITDVSTDVRSVKAEVADTRAELNKTTMDLRKAIGDMGVMSGLIATNSKELTALKALGDRNYFEFALTKAKTPQMVGNVSLQLRKADPSKNRYTIDVLAEDRKIEKKDKTTNEPVQFYLANGKQPCEIVVNSVTKDKIVGYLATPKVQLARQ